MYDDGGERQTSPVDAVGSGELYDAALVSTSAPSDRYYRLKTLTSRSTTTRLLPAF